MAARDVAGVRIGRLSDRAAGLARTTGGRCLATLDMARHGLARPAGDCEGALTATIRGSGGGGRLHEIDMRLDSAAELFSAVDRTSLDGGAALFVEWSTGFHLGIALASQLPFHNVTPVARVAAGVIAKAPTRLRQSVPSDFVAELHAAVTMLALDRTNRGPLGSLLKESITASARRLSRRCAD